jgi:hypothetical protein
MWSPNHHLEFPVGFRKTVATMIMASRRPESLMYLLHDEIVLFIMNKCWRAGMSCRERRLGQCHCSLPQTSWGGLSGPLVLSRPLAALHTRHEPRTAQGPVGSCGAAVWPGQRLRSCGCLHPQVGVVGRPDDGGGPGHGRRRRLRRRHRRRCRLLLVGARRRWWRPRRLLPWGRRLPVDLRALVTVSLPALAGLGVGAEPPRTLPLCCAPPAPLLRPSCAPPAPLLRPSCAPPAPILRPSCTPPAPPSPSA